MFALLCKIVNISVTSSITVHSAVGTSGADGGWALPSSEAQNNFISQVQKMLFLGKGKERYICEGGTLHGGRQEGKTRGQKITSASGCSHSSASLSSCTDDRGCRTG